MYVWRTIVTPYAVGGALPNVAGTVEARAIVRTPTILSINARVTNRKQRRVRISGLLRNGDANLGGVRVALSRGGKPKGKQPYNLGVRTRKATNTNGGVVAFHLRFKKKGFVYFQLSVTSPARDVTSFGCTPATATVVAVRQRDLSPFAVFSRVVRLRL
jgi:hypothetical protein